MQVDPLVTWITNYLTGCRTTCWTIEAPRGAVLLPFLFTRYTSDFKYCSQSCHLQKVPDDSAIVGCISREQEVKYRCVVDGFVECCELNYLQLNITKTKKVMDCMKDQAAPS